MKLHALIAVLFGLTVFLFSPAVTEAAPGELNTVAPGFAALAPETLVVVGLNAPAQEQAAAQKIAAALRACGGPADNLTTDIAGMHDLNTLIDHDLILVGTYSDNDVLHEQWGHFAIDYARYFAEPDTPSAAPHKPWYPGAPSSGFSVMGYGTFRSADTGYIEAGRNVFYLVPALLGCPDPASYRIRIEVTGDGPAGVARAAHLLLATGCMDGIAPGDAEALPKSGDAFALGRAQFTDDLPAWVPRQNLLGWLMADSTIYAGFQQASGRPASVIWRAKYVLPGGVATFDATPQRMSTASELLIAQLATPADAQAALSGLLKTLGSEKGQAAPAAAQIGGHPVFKSNDFIAAAKGRWVILCTVPDPLGSTVISKALDSAP